MRALALLVASVLLQTSQADYQPFVDTLQSEPIAHPLLKRQSGCPSAHTACTALNAPGACCPTGTNCARDQNGTVACCPSNAVCSGVISGTAPVSATSSTPFVLGGTTQTSITQSASLASGYSTLTGVPYPFLVIPTSYPNSQQCLNAFSSCQSASSACFNSLVGVNGVTVSGLGTQGVTQAATGTIPAESASSVCSSLSSRGCYNIQSALCSSFGSAGVTATTGTGFVQVNAGPAAVARCTGAIYTAAAMVVAAGAGVGMVMQ